MRIRVLGGGWYGCHLALSLLNDGHQVELHEIAGRLFHGASGNNPARLHLGFHYPRSKLTRAHCQLHHEEFMQRYGQLTRGVPTNIYAIAEHDSLVDFGTYKEILDCELQYIEVHDPSEYGLENVEGAVLTGERHLLVDDARKFFETMLNDVVRYKQPIGALDDRRWDMTVDCTFCALDDQNIDRYEPCLMLLMEGPVHTAITIMDGPFPSLYPWNNECCSLTSAVFTPFTKECHTYEDAQRIIAGKKASEIEEQGDRMIASMAKFYPEIHRYFAPVDYRLSVRAMPKSAADTRLVDIVQVEENAWRVRAGKIDAVLAAEQEIKQLLESRS